MLQVSWEKVSLTLLNGLHGADQLLNHSARTKILAAGIYLLYANGRVSFLAFCFIASLTDDLARWGREATPRIQGMHKCRTAALHILTVSATVVEMVKEDFFILDLQVRLSRNCLLSVDLVVISSISIFVVGS